MSDRCKNCGACQHCGARPVTPWFWPYQQPQWIPATQPITWGNPVQVTYTNNTNLA